MNFFHIPSFEDHYTMKIWLKNWNLPVNKNLFKLIHDLNALFNSQISFSMVRDAVGSDLLTGLLPYKSSFDDKMRFQIYIKDDFNPKDEISSHFYRKMHFLIFLVQIDSNDTSEITEILNSLKRFAFTKDLGAMITVAVCGNAESKRIARSLDNSIVLDSYSGINNERFVSSLRNIFLGCLREKIENIPEAERETILANKEDFGVIIKKKPIDFIGGKVLKLRGDVSMMLGSPVDGLNYYSKALQVLLLDKKVNSSNQSIGTFKIWIGSVLESISACHYDKVKIDSEKLPTTDDSMIITKNEVIQNSMDALANYMSENQYMMIFELRLKLLGFYSLVKDKKNFINQFNLLRDDLSQVTFDPRIFLYIGDLASNAGLKRLAIRSLYECSRLLKKTTELESIKEECFLLSARILQLDISNYNNNFELLDLLPKQVTYVILINLLDIQVKNNNTERALHYYLLLMRKFDVERTFKTITEEILWEYPFYRFEYDVLPFVQRVVPESRKKVFRALRKYSNDAGKMTDSVFIYDPRSRAKFIELNWLAQEDAIIIVYLTNPLPLYVRIDSLTIEADGVDLGTYSNDIRLAPFAKNYECKVKIRPIHSGIMAIKGVKMRICNLTYFNSIDTRGVGVIYQHAKMENPYIFEQYYANNDIYLETIRIAESVPIIEVQSRSFNPEILFYNENLVLQHRIVNTSKATAIDIKITVRVDYENAHTVYLEDDYDNLEIGHNKFVDLEFRLYQGQTDASTSKDTSFFKHLKNNKIICTFNNRSLADRVYKITTIVESKFRENCDYVGRQESLKSFKVRL